jgi:hypothetical protein
MRYTDPTGRYIFEEDPEDPWVFDNASVRSRYWYTHPESKVGQPSDAETIAAMTAPLWAPVAIVGGMVAGEVLLATGAAASTAVGGIVSGLAADGDPTNEIRVVGQALTADGDPFNEIRTGVDAAAQTSRIVLGHYPEYVTKAQQLGARYFSVPADVWEKMGDAERWAANQRFLDRAVRRGSEIILATPLDRVRPGSWFQTELRYLMDLGYRCIGDRLVK